MKRTLLLRTFAVAAMITLGACGGGGGGLPGTPDAPDLPEATPDRPIPSLQDAHYQTALGLPLDEEAEVASIAVLDAGGASQREGTVSLATDRNRTDGYRYDTDVVELAIQWEDDSTSERAEEYIFVAVGDDFFEQGFTKALESSDAYGNRVVILEHEVHGRRLYIPNEDSGVYVGAFSTNYDDSDMVAHSVFGRESTIEDLARQSGSARFDGIAEASVIANAAASQQFERTGNYRGVSGGNLDFTTGEFDLSATLTHENSDDMVGLNARGVMTDDGALISSAEFYNALDDNGEFTGSFEGQVFGPEATDIGATFSGEYGEPGNEGYTDPSVAIAGQMMLSR